MFILFQRVFRPQKFKNKKDQNLDYNNTVIEEPSVERKCIRTSIEKLLLFMVVAAEANPGEH